MENLEYVYHYTTIETLALILKNKTIRFNSLANVDDLDEQKAADLKFYGKYCFVSCWTTEEHENIALWNMYSKKGTGVRIRMPVNMFKLKDVPLPQGGTMQSVFEQSNITDANGYTIFSINPYWDVHKQYVEYTNSDRDIIPEILFVNGNSMSINWTKLANTKSSDWSFQKEYRFSFCAEPMGVNTLVLMHGQGVEVLNAFCKNHEPPFAKYDLDIDDEAFSKMEIVLGPSAEKSDEIILEGLVKTFNKDAVVKPSVLTNRVRFK